MKPQARASVPSTLTPSERAVATLVARGRTNREIARTLGLSPKTVEWKLTRIYRKCGVRSRTELALRIATGEIPWAGEPAE